MSTFFAVRGGWGKFRPGLGKLANRDNEFEFQSVYAYDTQCRHTMYNYSSPPITHKRHMENIDTKTRHKKGDKVHMFGWYG